MGFDCSVCNITSIKNVRFITLYISIIQNLAVSTNKTSALF
jgi:hypothetical protein